MRAYLDMREERDQLRDELELAQFKLKHIHENTQCIGLDQRHVDGNCIHCLSERRKPPVNKSKTVPLLIDRITQMEDAIDEVIDYCEPHLEQMWASSIVGKLLNADFRDARQAIAAYRANRRPT